MGMCDGWFEVFTPTCEEVELLFLFFKSEKHAARYRPARRPRDGFCFESLQASYFFSTAKRSNQERPLATKVLNRTKRLILGSLQMCSLQLSLKWHPCHLPLK